MAAVSVNSEPSSNTVAKESASVCNVRSETERANSGEEMTSSTEIPVMSSDNQPITSSSSPGGRASNQVTLTDWCIRIMGENVVIVEGNQKVSLSF